MKKFIYAAALTLATTALTPAAQAADYVCDGVSAPCDFIEADTTGSYSSKINASAGFDDFYEFVLSAPYIVTVTMTSSVTPFSFTDLELLASDKVTSLGTFLTGGVITPLMTSVGAGTYYVHVAGTNLTSAKATYTGTIDIAAVPETSTWAMMIAGIAAVGTAMRRRSTTAQVSFS